MSKFFVRMVPLFAAAVLVACDDLGVDDTITGNGPVIEENRPVGRFVVVSNSTIADIEILQGYDERLRIRAQENLLPYIRTRVVNNILEIYTQPGVILHATQRVVIELDVVDLVRIESSGSGFIDAPLLDARRLEVVTSGSGDIDLLDLLADSLIVIGSGSGNVLATGTTPLLRQRVVLSGSGQLDTRNLQAYEADVTLSGSGPATVRVRDRLRAVLSGSGTLRYYGNPQVTQSVTGSGRVERAGS